MPPSPRAVWTREFDVADLFMNERAVDTECTTSQTAYVFIVLGGVSTSLFLEIEFASGERF